MTYIPRQSYKALLWDYEYLLSKSDDECCYSLSEREVQILLATVDYIGWKTRYVAPIDVVVDQETIDEWQGNLARKLMSGCCPDDGRIGRFGADGQWETSDDGGATWTDNPDADPRNDYIGAPPLSGTPSNALRCAAADNVREQMKTFRDDLADLLASGTTVLAIIASIIALIGILVGLSGAGISISVLLFGLASQLLSLTPAIVQAQLNDTVMDEFRCLVYCRMEQNGQLTYDGWVQLLADIASTFNDFPETFFYSIVNGMGYIGVSNAGTIGAATASDCGDCQCDNSCAEKYQIYQNNPTYGSIVEYGDNYIICQTGDTGYLTLEAIDFNDCCYVNAIEMLSGTGGGTAFEQCGIEPSPPWIGNTPIGQCCSIIEVQWSTGYPGGQVKIFLDECP